MHCNCMSVSRNFLCNFHRRHLSMMLDHHSMVSKKTHYAQITLGAWTLWRLNFTLRYFGSPTWSLGANTARLFVSVGRCGEQVHRCNLWWWCSCGHMVVLHHRWRHQLRATGKWSPWSNLCKDCWSNWQNFLRLNQFCVQSIFWITWSRLLVLTFGVSFVFSSYLRLWNSLVLATLGGLCTATCSSRWESE